MGNVSLSPILKGLHTDIIKPCIILQGGRNGIYTKKRKMDSNVSMHGTIFMDCKKYIEFLAQPENLQYTGAYKVRGA